MFDVRLQLQQNLVEMLLVAVIETDANSIEYLLLEIMTLRLYRQTEEFF